VFANFGFKSGTRIIDFAGVPLIPRFASSVPQAWANLGIGTLVASVAKKRKESDRHRFIPGLPAVGRTNPIRGINATENGLSAGLVRAWEKVYDRDHVCFIPG
jgi:hypothetical protein